MADLHSLSRASRGLTIAEEDRRAHRQRVSLIVEGACDHRTRSQNGAHGNDGSRERDRGVDDVLATSVRANEVVAMDAEGTPVG